MLNESGIDMISFTAHGARGVTMNKDQIKGRVEEAKGKVKEVAGEAVGNERLKNEGKLDKAAGKTQSGYGDAKENVKDAIDKA